METKKNNSEYIPEFDKSFRHPRYWGAWLGVAAMAGIALCPGRYGCFKAALSRLLRQCPVSGTPIPSPAFLLFHAGKLQPQYLLRILFQISKERGNQP